MLLKLKKDRGMCLPLSMPVCTVSSMPALAPVLADCSWVNGFPGDSAGKESTCNAGDRGLIPGLGSSPGEGKGYPFQFSGLENSMGFIVHGVTKSQTQLSNFHFHFSESQFPFLYNETKTVSLTWLL